MVSRLQALIGAVAYGVDRAVATLLWFVPFRVPGALLLAALFGLLAWQQATAANHTLATYPTPRPTTIGAILDGDVLGWLRIEGLISGPYLDSRAYTPAGEVDVVRFYYVVRDPSRRQAVVVRSTRQAAEIGSARTLLVRIEKRPDAVAAAVAALPAEPQLSVNRELYVLELSPDEAGAAASPTSRAVGPSDLGAGQGKVALFSGSFGSARPVSCEAAEPACRDGVAYEYLATDGEHGVIVRSPYPPDALPVTLTGVVTPDAFRMKTVLENAKLIAALDGARTLGDGQLFVDGVTPPLPDVTFAPAIVLSGIATFLLISKLVGYPIFRRRRVPVADDRPLAAGEELRLELSGRVRGAHGTVRVDREPATLARLTPAQIARREWQFGGRPLGESASAEDAVDPTSTQPVLTSGGGSLLLPLDSLRRGLQMAAGQLVTVGASHPSLRLRGPGIDAVLGFADQATRARALAEIDPSRPRLASAPAGSFNLPPSGAAGALATDRRPWQLSVAALAFGLIGVGLVASGLLGLLPSTEPRHPIAVVLPAVVQSAIGAGLAFVASGLWRRHEWAREMGVNLGAAGIVASAVLALGETTCLRPLGPTLIPCQAGDLVGTFLALAALAGFGFSLWAIVTLRPYFR